MSSASPVAPMASTGMLAAKKNAGKKSKKKTLQVSSHPDTTATLKRRLQVDKAIVDELLLVCGVIGTVDPNTNEFVPVHECLAWLQDLQRAVRRDDDLLRPISLLLGQWKILQQKLLPLCLHSGRYDRPLLLTLCKILVMLTKPIAEHTERAGKIVINPKAKTKSAAGKDIHDKVVQEQIWLRENAIQQADLLLEYKKAFCQVHNQSKTGQGLFSIFVSLLAEPLGKTGRRTDEDHIVIELILHLFCNLLRAQPLFASGSHSMDHEHVHNELVHLMHQELVLDILCVLGSDLEHRDNAPYNLIVLETLHHLWKPYNPIAVAEAFSNQSTNSAVGPKKESLLGRMNRQRQSYAVQANTRHGNFGGTLQIQKKNLNTGEMQNKYMSTAQFAASTRSTALSNSNAGGMRQKSKRADVFVPSGIDHSRQGPSAQRARRVLYQFLERFCSECYGPMAKSLKGEFRRDSVKLQEGDQVLFLRFIKFVAQWWRLAKQQKHLKMIGADTNNEKSKQDTLSGMATCIGPLIFTMDVFTIDLVLRSIEQFQQLKQYPNLGVSVSVLSEMMYLLNTLFNSKESTEHVMALGLMDRLYYGSEAMDKLPHLISKWEPGTTTREYVADIVEICHMQLKLLESNEERCRSADSKKKHEDATVAQMQETARDFDLNSYIRKKLLSNHSVFLYTKLLSQFDRNSVTTNHRIVAFLKNRLSKQIIYQPDEDEELSELPSQYVSLQPMLYQFSTLRVLNRILSTASTLPSEQQKILVPWATSVVYDFSQAAERNPMLWVEALVAPTHVITRHCDQITNVYVSEELRMLMIKDQLQKQLYASRNEGQDSESDNDDEEEELEFDATLPEAPSTIPTTKRKILDDEDEDDTTKESLQTVEEQDQKKSLKRQKRAIEDDDESDEEELTFDTPAVADQLSKAHGVADAQTTEAERNFEGNGSDSENETELRVDDPEDSEKDNIPEDTEPQSKLSSQPSQSRTALHRAVLDDSDEEESEGEDSSKSIEDKMTGEEVSKENDKGAKNEQLISSPQTETTRRITVSPADVDLSDSDTSGDGLETQPPFSMPASG